jgi:hypothetical protein
MRSNDGFESAQPTRTGSTLTWTDPITEQIKPLFQTWAQRLQQKNKDDSAALLLLQHQHDQATLRPRRRQPDDNEDDKPLTKPKPKSKSKSVRPVWFFELLSTDLSVVARCCRCY